jgi:hypothetical protein
MARRRRLNIGRRVRLAMSKQGLAWGERERQECVAYLGSIVGGLSDKYIYWAVYRFNKRVLRNAGEETCL